MARTARQTNQGAPLHPDLARFIEALARARAERDYLAAQVKAARPQ